MSMIQDTKKSNSGNQQCLPFDVWFVMIFYATAILLQNAKGLFQSMSGGLLQNATFITKCVMIMITLITAPMPARFPLGNETPYYF